MDPARMNALLAGMDPEEIREGLCLVNVFERAGGASPDEAAEWRRRVLAWLAYLDLDEESARPS